MSYDIRLYPKDNKKPLSVTSLDVLKNTYDITLVKVEGDDVICFEAKFRNDIYKPFEYSLQEDGSYLTSISYGANDNEFENFRKLVKVLATKVNILIKDPQLGDELIEPEKYGDDDSEEKKRFHFAKDITSALVDRFIIPLYTKAKGKYFIKYIITSIDPSTRQEVMLTTGIGIVYCSKVNPGESLDDVLQRELPHITGSYNYEIRNITDGGTDFDNHGNKLLKVNLYIDVPYFTTPRNWKNFTFNWVD